MKTNRPGRLGKIRKQTVTLIRLDKLLSQSGERTRSDADKLIRAGFVTVDGVCVDNPAYKVDAVKSRVMYRDQRVVDAPYHYVMLHKPAGMLTAARDRDMDVVLQLLPRAMQVRGVMPVGRLDKDTTGLLLLTNDGTLAHRLLSPKLHVWKEYAATVDGPLNQADIDAFAAGIPLQDFTAKPAELRIERVSADESLGIVRIREGKQHQIKRMFAARGLQVTALHRQRFGPLCLDIPCGETRLLKPEEIIELYEAAHMEQEGRHG